jgi:hypothetical protein
MTCCQFICEYFFGFTQLLFFGRFCVSILVWGYFKLLSDLMLTGSFGRVASPGVPGWDILGVSHGPSRHPLMLVGLVGVVSSCLAQMFWIDLDFPTRMPRVLECVE